MTENPFTLGNIMPGGPFCGGPTVSPDSSSVSQPISPSFPSESSRAIP